MSDILLTVPVILAVTVVRRLTQLFDDNYNRELTAIRVCLVDLAFSLNEMHMTTVLSSYNLTLARDLLPVTTRTQHAWATGLHAGNTYFLV